MLHDIGNYIKIVEHHAFIERLCKDVVFHVDRKVVVRGELAATPVTPRYRIVISGRDFMLHGGAGARGCVRGNASRYAVVVSLTSRHYVEYQLIFAALLLVCAALSPYVMTFLSMVFCCLAV